MKCQVVITLTLEAEDEATAFQIGVAAAEHLLDTFNDDGSIHTLVEVESSSVPTH